MSGDAQGIDFDDFVAAMVDSETPDGEDSVNDTQPTLEADEDTVGAETADETDTDEDDEVYPDDVDDDEADDEPDDDSEEEDSEEGADEDTWLDEEITFKSDGEEVSVSRRDLLDQAKKNYGLDKNFTRRGQELAQKEKAVQQSADVVEYYRQTPERQKLQEGIKYAEEVIQRGFVFDNEGNQVQLSEQQINNTKNNVADARKKLTEMAPPPMAKEAQEAIPELWSEDPTVRNKAAQDYGDVLKSVGYTDAEMSTISPRELLLAKKALEGETAVKRVKSKKAKANPKSKPGVVKNPTKAAKGKQGNSSNESRPRNITKDAAKVEAGEMSHADFFMFDDD